MNNPKIPNHHREIQNAVEELDLAQTELDNLFNEYFQKIDKSNQEMLAKINLLSFVKKIVTVYVKYLKEFYGSHLNDNPTIPATLARGIFELHLMLIECTESLESFRKILLKTDDAYQAFTEALIDAFIEQNNKPAISAFMGELERIAHLKKKHEKMLGTPLTTSRKSPNPDPNFDFKKLSAKHGLDSYYRIEYKVLSSFIHGSLLNILTNESIDKTMPNEMRETADSVVMQRRAIVKNWAENLVLRMIPLTVNRIRKLVADYSLSA